MARSNAARDIKFPIGRMVMGSLYKASDKDADGKPRIVKTGQNAGQPTQQFFFAVAIPKSPGAQHWAHEPIWGSEIWSVGNACFPKIAENPAFAWKIVDGDSSIPNKKGIAPNSREGYPGNWVISFSSTYAPKVVNADGSAYILEPEFVLPGDFVEVHASVDGNSSTQNPGIYINHNVVSFQGYSVEGRIKSANGVDPTTVGFGKAAKPAGLSMVPPSGTVAHAPAPVPGPAPLPGAPVGLPPALPSAAAAAPLPTGIPLPVQPSPSFLAPPAAAAPAPLPPPAAPVGRAMSAKAAGHTYEALLALGWNDATLAANGMFA